MNANNEVIVWRRLNNNNPQLRLAIAHLLKHERLRGKLFDFDALKEVLNIFCGYNGNNDQVQINHNVIASAFQIEGGVKISRTPYSEHWVVEGNEGANENNERYYLYIDNGTQVPIGNNKKKAQYRIGCLSYKKKKNEEEGDDKERQSPSSIGKGIRSWLKHVDDFWEGMRDELSVFLTKKKATATTTGGGKGGGGGGNNKKGKKYNRKRRTYTPKKSSTPSTAPTTVDSTTTSTPPSTAGSGPLRKRRKEEAAKRKEAAKEKKRLIEDAMKELTKQLLQLKLQLKEIEEEEEEEDEMEEEERPQTPPGDHWLYYHLNGRAGKIKVNASSVTILHDLESGMFDAPPVNEEVGGNTTTRRRVNLGPVQYGKGQYIIPNAAALVGKNYLKVLHDRSKIVKKLRDLFASGNEQCHFSDEALRIMTMYGIHNMGGSDEGMEMLIGGVLKALFHDIGFKITNVILSKGCPSRRTIARIEYRLCADCYFHAVAQMKKDQVKYIFLIVDHGKRNGIEHFVKLVKWGGFDKNGNRVLKTFCLDMDMSGHTAASAVDAIELSLKKLERAGLDLDGVTVSAAGLTGDTGGGAGLPNIFPLMVKDERILCRFATMMGCQMHALNNCLSNALKACFGDTGIGKNNAVQASYVYVLMIKRLKEELDSRGLDELMELVLEEMKTNERWKNEASWQNKDGLSALFSSLDGEIDDDDVDAISNLFRGNQEPVFSRWATVIPSLKTFANPKHWIFIYFLAVVVKQSNNDGSLLRTYSDTLLSCMNIRAKSDEYSVLAAAGTGEEEQQQVYTPPTLYIQALFATAFAEAWFDRHFDFLKHYDETFGKGCYGHTLRFYPERVYVMHRDLAALENDGWKDHPAFAKYLAKVGEIVTIVDEQKTDGGKMFFERTAKVFLDTIRSSFNDKIASTVRMLEREEKEAKAQSNAHRILPCIVGGHPSLQREFLLWLHSAEEYGEGTESDEGFQHSFASIEITLDHKEGDAYNEPLTINTRECMEYLTARVSPFEIMKIDWIRDNKDLLWKMATSAIATPVDIFDNETWGEGNDFEPIKDVIHKRIAPQPVHQQEVESHVQSGGHVRQTKVGEGRGSRRNTIHSYHMRTFNRDAKEAVRATKSTPEAKKRVKRVEGSIRMQLYGDICVDPFNAELQEVLDEGENRQKHKEFIEYLHSDESKQSTKENAKSIEKYKKGMKKNRRITKAEEPKTQDNTPDCDGGIQLSFLTRAAGYEPHMDAEIIARGLNIQEDEQVFPVEEMTIKKKKELLKDAALKDRRLVLPQGAIIDEKLLTIEPISDMMKTLYEDQMRIRDKKRAENK